MRTRLFLTVLVWVACALAAGTTLVGCAKRTTVSPPDVPTAIPAPPSEELRGRPYTVNGKTYYPLLKVDEYVEQGIASWYGAKFHGRTTSSGEVYDMNSPTAAHRILPFGSVVEVVNLKNGKKTVVTINDRGPFLKERIIDLSRRGAQELELVGPGTAPVKITVVAIDDRYAQPKGSGTAGSDAWSGSFAVQVGAFSKEESARRLKEKLSCHYKDVYVAPFAGKAKTFYRVRIGTYETLKETIKVQKHLEATGYQNTFMVAE